MSFVTQDDVFAAMEALFVPLFREFKPDWPVNETGGAFQRLTYRDSMLRYGTDKPDLRIPFEISDLTPLFAKSEFKAFAGKDRAGRLRCRRRSTNRALGSIICRRRRRSWVRRGRLM